MFFTGAGIIGFIIAVILMTIFGSMIRRLRQHEGILPSILIMVAILPFMLITLLISICGFATILSFGFIGF